MKTLSMSLLLAGCRLCLAAAPAAADKPEEIVIKGQQDVYQLQKETFHAAERVYGLYNKLNDDPNFHITCHYEQPTGSRLTRINCRPDYIDKLLVNYDATPEDVPIAIIHENRDELLRRMNLFIGQNPELRQAMIDYNTLNNELQSRLSPTASLAPK